MVNEFLEPGFDPWFGRTVVDGYTSLWQSAEAHRYNYTYTMMKL